MDRALDLVENGLGLEAPFMESTSQGCDAPYLGVDLTDRYAKTVRPIDLCGLRLDGGRLRASYWQWLWSEPESALDVEQLDINAAALALGTPAPELRHLESQARQSLALALSQATEPEGGPDDS